MAEELSWDEFASIAMTPEGTGGGPVFDMTPYLSVEAAELAKHIQVFIIAQPSFRSTGEAATFSVEKVPCALEQTDFVQTLAKVGMRVKVLDNFCKPAVKVNTAGQTYCGDSALKHLFVSDEIWRKMSASPSSLGCLVSHLNCWEESIHMDSAAWALVMEEDVVPHENTSYFFSQVLNMLASKHTNTQDLKLVHLVHDRDSHDATRKLVNSPQFISKDNMHLLKAPKNNKNRHVNVGQGTRAYLISGELMEILTSKKFKWTTWIDIAVPSGTQAFFIF